MDQRKIEIWSSFPSPVGGVSIHAYRLLCALSKKFEIEGVNFSTEPLKYSSSYIRSKKSIVNEILRLLFKDKKNIIHLHTQQLIPLCILISLFSKRIVLTLHNKNILGVGKIKKQIYLFLLKKVRVVFINEKEVFNFLLKNKINAIKTPAFLPPNKNEVDVIPKEFYDFKKENELIASMSVWTLNENSFKVYGLENVIPILLERKDLAICLCISGSVDTETLDNFEKEIKDHQLSHRVLFLINKISNGSIIWRNSDFFIRPTSTDAEGISIKEALYCGTPVLASNVCTRPKQTMLFDYGNIQDFKKKVNELIFNLNQLKKNISIKESVVIESAETIISQFYEDTLMK